MFFFFRSCNGGGSWKAKEIWKWERELCFFCTFSLFLHVFLYVILYIKTILLSLSSKFNPWTRLLRLDVYLHEICMYIYTMHGNICIYLYKNEEISTKFQLQVSKVESELSLTDGFLWLLRTYWLPSLPQIERSNRDRDRV